MIAAAQRGDARAQTVLGMMYEHAAAGVQHNDAQAVAWYQRAANQRFPRAQYNLGFMYLKGRGIEKDLQRALSLYTLAAPQIERAKLNCAIIFLGDSGFPRDDAQGLDVLEAMANAGNANAANSLGMAYYYGVPVHDLTRAAHWFRIAAEAGLTIAQSNLGQLYYNGQGVTRDYVEARRYL